MECTALTVDCNSTLGRYPKLNSVFQKWKLCLSIYRTYLHYHLLPVLATLKFLRPNTLLSEVKELVGLGKRKRKDIVSGARQGMMSYIVRNVLELMFG